LISCGKNMATYHTERYTIPTVGTIIPTLVIIIPTLVTFCFRILKTCDFCLAKATKIMTRKERDDKKEIARVYYMRGEPQKVIASLVGVSEVTVSKWVNAENWDMKRAAERVTRPELVNQNLQLIARLQAQVINSDNPLAEAKGVSDQISKLAATIEKLDKKTNIVQIQDGFIAFSKWLQEHPALRSVEGMDFIKQVDKYQGGYLDYRFSATD